MQWKPKPSKSKPSKSKPTALTMMTLVILPNLQTAWAKPYTPAAGSAERKAIMDAMRKVVGKPHKKKIIFTADHLKVENGWAYFGGRFDYADKSRVSADFGWGNLSCLLHLEKKVWRVKRYIHNTDVAEQDYIEMFPQAPRAIFDRKYR